MVRLPETDGQQPGWVTSERQVVSDPSVLFQQAAIDGNSSFGAFRNRDRNEQDITRGIPCDVNTGHAAFFGERVVDDAAFFIAFAAKPFRCPLLSPSSFAMGR